MSRAQPRVLGLHASDQGNGAVPLRLFAHPMLSASKSSLLVIFLSPGDDDSSALGGERGGSTALDAACKPAAGADVAGSKDEHSASGLCRWRVWGRIVQRSPRDGIAELRLLLEAGHDLFATDTCGRSASGCMLVFTHHRRVVCA